MNLFAVLLVESLLNLGTFQMLNMLRLGQEGTTPTKKKDPGFT